MLEPERAPLDPARQRLERGYDFAVHKILAAMTETVPLTTLPRPASIKLLRLFRPDTPAEDPALGAIADEPGDLPLALHFLPVA